MRSVVTVFIFLLAGHMAAARRLELQSPNGRVVAGLYCVQGGDKGEWYLNLRGMIQRISLGLVRSDQEFWQDLRLIKTSKPRVIDEAYTAVHGKRSQCRNKGNEIIVLFENAQRSLLELVIRAYDDGLAFRYRFPGGHDSLIV